MSIHDRMRGLCYNANVHKKWKKVACAEYAQYFRPCYGRTGRLRRTNSVIGQIDRRTRDRLILAADEQLVARYAVGEGQLLHGEECLTVRAHKHSHRASSSTLGVTVQWHCAAAAYFSDRPSWKARPTAAPSARYVLLKGSKVMGRTLAGSTLPASFSALSSQLTLTISPTRRQVSGS